MINNKLHPISYTVLKLLQVIIVEILEVTLRFWAPPPFAGLGAT